jgi:hypothetical protein
MTGNRDKIATALREFGQAAYELADALLDQPAASSSDAGAGGPSPAPAYSDDLPAMEGSQQPKSRDEVYAECPDHQRRWVARPGGISKNGRSYPAFWSCPSPKNERGEYCKKKPDPSWARAHDPEQALFNAA